MKWLLKLRETEAHFSNRPDTLGRQIVLALVDYKRKHGMATLGL